MRALALLVAAFAVAVCGLANAAPALRASTPHDCGFQTGTAPTCALSAAVTAGDLIVVTVLIDSGATVSSVTDSVNGAHTLADTAVHGTGAVHDYVYFFANSGAGTPTVTVNTSNGSANNIIKVDAYSGVKTTSAKIASNHSDEIAAAGTITCASASATAANQLMFGFLAQNSGSAISPNNGETERLDGNFSQIEDKLTAGSGSVAPQWAATPNESGGCVNVIWDTAATGAFDSTAAVSSRTTTAYTVIGSLSAGGTVKAVACYRGSTAPTIAEINAAQCTGASTPAASGNQSPSMAPFDFSITLTPSQSPPYPLYDLYVTDGTTRTSLPSEFLTAPSTCGLASNQPCQFVALTSVAIGSIAAVANLGYDAQTANFVIGETITGGTSGASALIIADTDGGSTGTLNLWIASGTFQDNETLTGSVHGVAVENGTASYLYAASDVLVAPTYVMPGGSGIALTIAANGNASYTSGSERETAYNIKIYDASAVGYASGDIDLVVNDLPPTCPGGTLDLTLALNVLMTPIDWDVLCSDGEGDVLNSIAVGTAPTGLSLNGTSNVISGTPTMAGVGTSVRYVVYDVYGALTYRDVVFDVDAGWPMPDCITTLTSTFGCAAPSSFITQTIVTGCSATVPVGYVMAQQPAPGATLTAGDVMTLTVAAPCQTSYKSISCLRTTFANCQVRYQNAFLGSVLVAGAVSCPSAAYQHDGLIYSQSPAAGAMVPALSTVQVRYCQ